MAVVVCSKCYSALHDEKEEQYCPMCGQELVQESTHQILEDQNFYPLLLYIDINKYLRLKENRLCKIYFHNFEWKEIENVKIKMSSPILMIKESAETVRRVGRGFSEKPAMKINILPEYSGDIVLQFTVEYTDARGNRRFYRGDTEFSIEKSEETTQHAEVKFDFTGAKVMGVDLSELIKIDTDKTNQQTVQTEICRIPIPLELEEFEPPVKPRQYIAPQGKATVSPVVFLETGYDTIAVVLKDTCIFGRSPHHAEIEIPVFLPGTQKRDAVKVEKISRCHFQIKYTKPINFHILDLSTHGTYVNDEKIRKANPHRLKNNDCIQLVKEQNSWMQSFTYREFISQQTGEITAARLHPHMPGSPRLIVFLFQEATLGSTEDDVIYLPLSGIKKEHARLLREDEKVWIEPISGDVMVNNRSVGCNEIMQITDNCEIVLAGNKIKITPKQTRFWKGIEI
jgi:hypothetical protein